MKRPLAILAFLVATATATASDWTNWRGPLQTGVGLDKNLPDKVEGNVVWRAPFGSRSTPLVLKGKVYFINYDAKKVKLGMKEEDVPESIRERVMCLNADTGTKVWEHTFPVFHTDIVTSRLGWTNIAADPATGNIYAHGTQGLFMCLDGKTGNVIWQHSMGEEYGRVSGYGGRITSPIVDEDLAILGMVNSSWGEQAKGANRYVAFNKLTGEVVWWSEPAASRGTYYSAPTIATINGVRLLICGAADGSVFALKVRTGEVVWRYTNFSISPINSSPVVDGNFVFIGHGEESQGTSTQGRVICLDASKVENGTPKLVWQKDGIHARYASPIIQGGRLYMPDDGGLLYCMDAKSGDTIWKFRYGRGEIRGSPVLADGKIYVGEVSSRFHILEPGAKKCKRLDEQIFFGVGGIDVELNGSPAVANGRVYFSTAEEMLCIGTKDGVAVQVDESLPPAPKLGKITHLQVVPAEIALYPGQSAAFKVRGFDANGNFVSDVKAEWSLPAPAPPPGVKANPPALKGEISPAGKLTVDAKMPNQGSIVVAKAEGLTGKARVRVVPTLPYFTDFEKIPDGAVPGGWVNTQGKFKVKTVDGNKVLAKVTDKFSPLFSVGNAYITLPTAKDYTIECDVYGTEVVTKEDGKEIVATPDIGVVANRYTLLFAGNVKPVKLVITSWDALPRIDKSVNFPWKPNTWYRLKLTTQIADGKGIIKGKAWPRDEKEPADWLVEVTDAYPVTEGSAALYGYVRGNSGDVPGTDIYYDNLRIMPNKAGGKASASVPAQGPEPVAQPVSLPGLLELCPESRRPFVPLWGRLRR